MANQEPLEILTSGIAEWNEWRANHSTAVLAFNDADLSGEDLSSADLSFADLSGANLFGATLTGANLRGANLNRAYLRGATLISADLSFANLSRADLRNVELMRADLSRAALVIASLIGADLSGANLLGANLSDTNLRDANLNDANLNEADLSIASLSQTKLEQTNFSRTIFESTALVDVDLSTANGLETVRHFGPSSIGIDTIYRSGGNIPEVFLRGCGVPEDFITYSRSLVGKAIDFYSCFISYSTKDEEFSRWLYSRMRDERLRVWFAPEDIKGGEKLHEQIEQAIRIHDKLLLVLSESSLQSEWVMTEIRNAREAELRNKRRKLFPIRLVDMETIKKWKCLDADSGKDLGVEVREYFIPDFTNWKNHDAFETAFARLLRDMRAKESS